MTKYGSGTLTMSGANSYTGNTTVSAGTLALGASDVLTNTAGLNVTGGTFAIGAYSDTVGAVILSYGSITGTTGVLTGSSYSVTNSSGTTTISAKLAGSGGLTKSGAGTLTLSGANTYDGVTAVDAGTVIVTNNSGLGSTTGGTTVASGAVLDLNGVTVGAEGLTLAGGTLRDVTSSLAGNITLTANSILDTSTGDTLTLSGIISGNGYGITKTGAGTVVLSNANTYTGATNIDAGTLTVSGSLSDSTAVTVASGATYNVNASDTVGSIAGAHWQLTLVVS
ncbi:MAG: hypothetical protein EBV83_09710 [Verrucomicrobia bacterium]|nr:hypothetical protein [Verrucomicrobiota bacterium]